MTIAQKVYQYWRLQGLSPVDAREQVSACLAHKRAKELSHAA